MRRSGGDGDRAGARLARRRRAAAVAPCFSRLAQQPWLSEGAAARLAGAIESPTGVLARDWPGYWDELVLLTRPRCSAAARSRPPAARSRPMPAATAGAPTRAGCGARACNLAAGPDGTPRAALPGARRPAEHQVASRLSALALHGGQQDRLPQGATPARTSQRPSPRNYISDAPGPPPQTTSPPPRPTSHRSAQPIESICWTLNNRPRARTPPNSSPSPAHQRAAPPNPSPSPQPPGTTGPPTNPPAPSPTSPS